MNKIIQTEIDRLLKVQDMLMYDPANNAEKICHIAQTITALAQVLGY